MRGKQNILVFPDFFAGTIPACAGETAKLPHTTCGPRDYPRVCGGNVMLDPDGGGLSPRVLGKRLDRHPRGPLFGTIPACAGETLPIFRKGTFMVPSKD